MRSQVTVSWSDTATYRFDLEEVQPMPHEQARAWLDEQFTAMECEPTRLTGKVLTADKVLAVALAAGPGHFLDAKHRDWAVTYARAASAALAKPVVSVDLARMSVGY
ncbi:hypothetical protein [Hydrogenophaga sp.]|uniref:hypothetical protein n=1 Tax=Hydrogenophaga sp. TaxID=1904254 RepID=UPI0025BEBA9E|nr:hypothetical protein [Hydrogenophaga sp.]